ncbi:MAG: hypothetical protein ABI852_05760 [Gemmatimonadaceae bacterium]
MTLPVRNIVFLGVFVLASACIPLSNGRVYRTLRIAGKPSANTLMADDSSICGVSSATFARVQVGEQHRCVWERPTAAKRAISF